ncbi:MAG: hypothetical protein LBK28_09360 [Propionibacteriaceae bacterium]|jgi:type VI protein secretion system component VasK|nr:hypothetical protein [Propionibacteriaceae bacterium]
MATFGVMVISIILTVLALVGGLMLYYVINRREIEREQANIQAAMRAWHIQQQEFAAEQRIRQTTRTAVDQMMKAARQRESPRDE